MAGTKSLGTLTVDLEAKTGKFSEGMSQAERSTDKLNKATQKQQTEFDRLVKKIDPLQGKFRDLDKAQSRLDRLYRQNGTMDAKTYDDLSKKIEQQRKSLNGLNSVHDRTNSQLVDMKRLAQGAAAAIATIGLGNLASQGYDAIASSQKLQASLKTVTDSAEAASAAWDNLLGFASTTPFTLDQSVEAFIRMKSLGLDPTNAALTSFGNTSSAMGKDLMQMIEAVADASTFEFERLKEFGIRASQQGDQVTFTFQGVETTVQKSSAAITQYLENIGNTAFAGAMSDQMDTLNGQAANLEDSIYQLWLAVGDAGATDIFASGISDSAAAVNELKTAVESGVFDWIFDAYKAIDESGKRNASDLRQFGSDVGDFITAFKIYTTEAEAKFYDLKAAGIEAFAGIATGSADAINKGLIPIQKALNYLDETFANLLANVGGMLGPLGTQFTDTAQKIRANLIDPIGISAAGFENASQAARDHAEALRLDIKVIQNGEIAVRGLNDWMFKGEESTKKATKATQDNTVSAKDAAKAKAAAAKAEREHAKAVEDSRKAIQSLFSVYNKTGNAASDFHKNLKDIQNTEAYLINSSLEMSAAIGLNAIAYNQALREQDPYYKRLEELKKSYGGNSDKAKKLASDIAFLRTEISKGGANVGDLVEQLKAAEKEQIELAKSASDAGTEVSTVWEESLKRVDDAFSELFVSAFSGFDQFKSSMLSAAKQMAGEMAYNLTIRDAVVGGTGSGGKGGFSLTNMKSLYDIAGGNSMGTNLEGAGAFISRHTGIGASAGTGLYSTAGGYTGQFGNSLSTGGAGGIYSGASRISNLAYAGYGIGGSLAGGWANSALGFENGTESQIGSAIGTAIGTAILPGIGTGIGAALGSVAGGAISKIFGGGREQFAKTWSGAQNADPVNFYRDYYRNTDLGTVGILDKQKMDPKPLIDWINNIEQIDNQIAAMVNEGQLEAVRKELAQADKFKGTDLSKVTISRYTRTIDALAESSGDVTKMLLEKIGNITKDNIESQLSKLGQSLQLGGLVEGLTGNVREYAMKVINANADLEEAFNKIQESVTNYSTFKDIAIQLNLTFDAMSDSAIDVANVLTKAAGGLDNLSSSATAYYQSFYTDAEKTARATDQLNAVTNDFGLSATSSKEQFRSVVESLDLNTDAGRKAYTVLMNVSGAFISVTQSAEDARRTLASDVVNAALQKYNNEVSLIDKAAQARTQQLNAEQSALENLLKLSDSLLLSNQSILTPLERLKESQKHLTQLQVQAKAGDVDAVSQLSGATSSYLDAAASYYGQSSDAYAAIFKDVNGGLDGLKKEYQKSVNSLSRADSLMLDTQRRAQQTLLDQLSQEIRQNDSLRSISDILSLLPADLAAALQSALPDNKSGSLNDRFARANDQYLKQNADVDAAVKAGVFKSGYEHYLKHGQYESNRGGFPAFASGGYHTGGIALVGEEGPELVDMGPSRVYNALDTKSILSNSSNSELVSEIRSLRNEVAQLRKERSADAQHASRQRNEQIDEQASTRRQLKPAVRT